MNAMVETMGVARVAWLVAAMACVTAPFAFSLPPWMVLGIVVLATWRIVAEGRGAPATSTRVRVLVSLLMVAGLTLGGNIGFGPDAAMPVFVGFLWIKLLELRSERDFLLLCFLAYFLVAVLLITDSSLATCLCAVGFLTVITMAAVRYHTGREASSSWRTTATLVLQALPLAAAVFLLFPRLQLPLPNLGGQGISGFSDTIRPGDIARMALSDQVVFRAEPEGGAGVGQGYWRGLVMNRTDGARWWYAPSNRSMHLPLLADEERLPLVVQTITLMPHNQRWLFALENPTRQPEHTQLLANRTLQYNQPVAHVLRYSVESRVGARANDVDERALGLPEHGDPRVPALAIELTRNAPTVTGKIQRVLDFLHAGEFTYSLSPGQMAEDPVATFLFERRSGFCAHYASAFCLLMRYAGVPARMIVGYRGGELNAYGGFITVRQENAHAWCEVAMDDGGWTRVDPTVGVPMAPGETLPAATQAAGGVSAGLDHSPAWMPAWLRAPYRGFGQWWQYVDARWEGWAMSYDADQQSGLLARFGLAMLHAPGIAVLLVCVIGGALAGLYLWMRWRLRRRPDALLELYGEFCSHLAAAGVPRRPSEGPIDYSQRAAAALPAGAAVIREIGWLYTRLRYGAGEGSREESPEAFAHLRQRIRALRVARAGGAVTR